MLWRVEVRDDKDLAHRGINYRRACDAGRVDIPAGQGISGHGSAEVCAPYDLTRRLVECVDGIVFSDDVHCTAIDKRLSIDDTVKSMGLPCETGRGNLDRWLVGVVTISSEISVVGQPAGGKIAGRRSECSGARERSGD